MECLENLMDKLHKAGLSYWLFNTVKNVSSIYIDMTKDTLLMFTILVIIGGPTSLYYFLTKLTTVVVLCLFGTIAMPILCTSILHTMEELEKDPKTTFCTKFLKYTISIFIAPIRPLLLTLAYDENRTQRKIKRGIAKSGSLDRRCCTTAPNGRIDFKLSMEGSFGR